MIYLAAPLFNPRELTFNLELAERLEQVDEVFLPQRDGSLLVNMLAAGVPREVAQRRVFAQDLEAMRGATMLVAVLDGAHIDEGVAFEIGFSNALGKVCVGFQTDVRRALPSGNNPMIERALGSISADVGELIDRVRAIIDAGRGGHAMSIR